MTWTENQLDTLGQKLRYLKKFKKLNILIKDFTRLAKTGQIPFPSDSTQNATRHDCCKPQPRVCRLCEGNPIYNSRGTKIVCPFCKGTNIDPDPTNPLPKWEKQ